MHPDNLVSSRKAARRSAGTFQIASTTIPRFIFDLPALAVDERDRHLVDPEAARARGRSSRSGTRSPASRSRRGRSARALAPEALEAARQVAHRDAEEERAYSEPPRRDEPPAPGPSRDPPPGDVARAEHEVGVVRGRDQPRHVVRVVREVAVHLEHELGAERRAPAGSRRGTRARAPPCPAGAARRRSRARRSRSASSPVPSGELSSTTSTRSIPAAPRRARGSSARGSRARCRWAGRRPLARLRTLRVDGSGGAEGGPGGRQRHDEGRALAAARSRNQISPPWASTSALLMASPRPVPADTCASAGGRSAEEPREQPVVLVLGGCRSRRRRTADDGAAALGARA